MKKIGLFLSARPFGGGVFQYNLTMLEAVNSLPQNEFDVIVAYTHPLWEEYLKDYSIKKVQVPMKSLARIIGKIYRMTSLPVKWWRYISRYVNPMAKVLILQKCDLWIFPSQESLSFEIDVPALASIHDLMHRYERRFPEVSSRKIYLSREKRYTNICKWAKGVLVDSEIGRQQVYESYGMPKEEIFVLPYIPPKYIKENKSKSTYDLNKKYMLPEKFIFYPSQFWMHKNHERLLKAIEILKDEIPDINLVLAGEKTNCYAFIRGMVEELDLSQNVHFMGHIPDEDMPEFYRRARAMVMPTFFGPTNIPPLEAFMIGCPVAISNIYGIPEQVGEAALMFNPESIEEIADCIRQLWTDDKLCMDLVKKGKQRSEQWGQPQYNKKLKSIIKSLLKCKGNIN